MNDQDRHIEVWVCGWQWMDIQMDGNGWIYRWVEERRESVEPEQLNNYPKSNIWYREERGLLNPGILVLKP